MGDGSDDRDLEQAFDLIAAAIDEAGEEKERAFLAALALTLAHKTNDITAVADAVAAAKQAVEI